jgi:hypothetical protein
MQNIEYSTFGLARAIREKLLIMRWLPISEERGPPPLRLHEHDPPKRVIGFGSGEHSFSKMSFLVFPGLGGGANVSLSLRADATAG